MLRGDEAAFDTFVDEYYPRLYRFAYRRMGGDQEAAQDVVQSTFATLIPKIICVVFKNHNSASAKLLSMPQQFECVRTALADNIPHLLFWIVTSPSGCCVMKQWTSTIRCNLLEQTKRLVAVPGS